MEKALFGFLGVAWIAFVFFIMDKSNRNRIRDFIFSKGGGVIKITWAPLGDWLFKEWHFKYKGTVCYHVVYVDCLGAQHDAYCRLAFWTDIYFTKDVVM